jgi:succinate dehydrogenase / fumarate reductase cytochrome b subunit
MRLFFKENKLRPLSLHLSHYLTQATSLFSIFHRASGVILSVFILSMIGGYFLINFLLLVFFFDSFLYVLFYVYFFMLFFYHFFNGLRHLGWDLGWFLEKKLILKTLVMVLCSSLICLFLGLL